MLQDGFAELQGRLRLLPRADGATDGMFDKHDHGGFVLRLGVGLELDIKGAGAEPVDGVHGDDFERGIRTPRHFAELIHGRLMNRLRRFRRGEKSQVDIFDIPRIIQFYLHDQ